MDMMDIERKALYNLLRMNWLNDPEMSVENWQVEDYRLLPLESIFERLRHLHVQIDKNSLIAFSAECDTPEELAENLISDEIEDVKVQDQIYLLVFELWRRLIPEKPCLSIFCDEIDHQIFLYDKGVIEDLEKLQDLLADLQVVLDEHVDEGVNPKEAFASLSASCANDLETFIYDFISEQIDENNDLYAADLLEAFKPYVKDVKWFDHLSFRLQMLSDPASATKQLKELLKNYGPHKDLEFNLELLAAMVPGGNHAIFYQLVKQTIPLLRAEEDFKDLASICSDFYHYLDHESTELQIRNLLTSRNKIKPDHPFNPHDQASSSLLHLIARE